MTKRLAITIAGAVSLGSYEAGVMFEVLDALSQHNSWAAKNAPDVRVEIDVLSGASAGGMTAAITALSLLFDQGKLANPYDNPLFNAWVRDIDIVLLLARQQSEDITHSVLSSDCIVAMSRRYLTPTPPIPSPAPDAHPALVSTGKLQLGLALSNLNGVDYARPTMTGGQFTYTRHADQYVTTLDRGLGYVPAVWEDVRAPAVACGAFPIAFRVQDLIRNLVDFANPYLVPTPWKGQPSTRFSYTDGGVFQNEPLGMAKNLVERIAEGNVDAQQRGYLFIAPRPKASDANGGFSQSAANYQATIARLASSVIGQAAFQDWAMAESINDNISLLNRRATQLKALFDDATLTPTQAVPITEKLLELFFAQGAEAQGQTLAIARAQLRQQYGTEFGSFSKPDIANAWLDALLLLELSANLHQREEMFIYDFTADPTILAGGQLFAFTGFFDAQYRQHDYEYGRNVAQRQLAFYRSQPDSVFAGLNWTPKPLGTINPDYNNLPMVKVDVGKRKRVYTQLMDAVDSLLTELGANWLERKAAETFLIRKHVKKLLAL